MTYTTKKLAEVKKDHAVASGMRGVRIIQKDLKQKDGAGNQITISKESFYVEIPQLTDNFVQTFIANEKGLQLVKEYVETLQDKACRVVICDKGRSIVDADLTIDTLIEIGEATSTNVRVTKELVNSMFDAEWKMQIAYAIVLERDAAAAAILLGEDEAAKAEFWDSAACAPFVQIACNYKQFILYACEREPSFSSEAIKTKVLQAVSYLDQESQVVAKIAIKLAGAPIASADSIAL